MLIILVLVTLFFARYLWTRKTMYYWTWKLNGRWGYPFIGCIFEFANFEGFLKNAERVRKGHPKNTVFWFGPIPFFYLSDPKAVEIVLISNDCVDKSRVYDIAKSNFGNGLFSLKNPEWSHHRRLINPAFRLPILKSFLPIFNEHVDILLDTIENNCSSSLRKKVVLCTMDVACETTTGKKMNFQQDGSLEVMRAYKRVSQLTIKRLLMPPYYSDWVFEKTKLYQTLTSAQSPIKGFIKNLIIARLENNNSESPVIMNKNDISDTQNDIEAISKCKHIFIDQILQHFHTKQLTFEDVENDSNSIVVAAYHTTANTISYTIMLLAMHPEIQERVFAEIVSICPEKSFQATYAQIENLHYTEQVINETLRLFAAIPMFARCTANDVQITDDIIIPKGTQIVIDAFNMQRDESLWGPNASKFDPDHMATENMSRMHPYSFIPFAKGIRSCIGSKYAMMFIKVALARILRKYRFETDTKFEDIHYQYEISVQIANFPDMRIIQRDN